MRLASVFLIGVVACTGSEVIDRKVSPDASSGSVPSSVQPVVTFQPWWYGFDREDLELVELPSGDAVGTSVVAYDNGYVFAPSFNLAEGGQFGLGEATFRVDPSVGGVAPTEGPWTSELVDAVSIDGLVLRLEATSTPPAPWYELDVRVSSDCQIALIAVGGVASFGAVACELTGLPTSLSVAHRPVDWDGQGGTWSEPRVVNVPDGSDED